MAKPVFEIYVDEKNVEKAVEIIKQMSLSDSSVKSRRMGHRIAALIMVGVVAVGICLSIIL
jgi:pentatricopeptide repeat protein